MANVSRRYVLWLLGGAAFGAGLGAAYRRSRAEDPGGFPLRPPGAGDEDEFLAACTRCGQCVQACPHDTLKLADLIVGPAAETPYVIARDTPCYLCLAYDEPLCIAICPTSALSPVADRREIRMGVAVIDTDRCRPYIGRGCPRPCWLECPFMDEAIWLMRPRRRPVIDVNKCVGCGICEHLCVTEPSSIIIRPASAKMSLTASERAAT